MSVRRAERRPVVLSAPLGLQKEAFQYLPDYTSSTDLLLRQQVVIPDPSLVDEVVRMVSGEAATILDLPVGTIRSRGAPQADGPET